MLRQSNCWTLALVLVAAGCESDAVTMATSPPMQATSIVAESALRTVVTTTDDAMVSALTDATVRVIPELSDLAAREALAVPFAELTAIAAAGRLAQAVQPLARAQAVLNQSDGLDPDLAALSLVLDQVALALGRNASIPFDRTQNRPENLP